VTVTATAEMAGLNVPAYLTANLDACGRNGGKPLSGPAWNDSCPGTPRPPNLRAWAQPPPPG
jgi:transposase